MQCAVGSVQREVFSEHCTVPSVKCVQSSVWIMHFDASRVQCAMCSVKCAVCSVQCAVYRVHYTMYDVQKSFVRTEKNRDQASR